MAIKDQCEHCRKYNSSCTENIVFDGQSCTEYRKHIDLTKKEEKIELHEEAISTEPAVVETTSVELPDPNQRIHGWLLWMLIAIGLGGLASAIMPILTYNVEEYSGSHILAMTDVLLGFILLLLGIYTVYSFIRRKPNAIFLGKMYWVVVFVTNLLGLMSGEFEASSYGSLRLIVRSLMWSGIWFVYLSFSEQVKDIIPKSYRKAYSRDYYFMGALILFPFLMLGMAVGDVRTKIQEKEQRIIESINLADNEYTDGRIVFTRPEGYTCEKQEIEDPKLTLFDLELNEKGYMRICSDYDTDISQKNFNEYWLGWQDESLNEFTFREIINEKQSIHGNPYYIKSVRYDTEVPIIWHYVLLFNQQTEKVCIVSYYQFDENHNSLIDILNSIKFL